jgi:uncharacterized membrane protein YecN with MAPEG domain
MSEPLNAAAIYAALNSLILLVLSYNVGRHRGRTDSLEPGATGDAILTRAIRAHGNAAEYMPLAMIMLIALALLGAPVVLVHALGASFTVGRIFHAAGMFRENHPNNIRFIGNLMTGLVYLIGPISCIYYGLT